MIRELEVRQARPIAYGANKATGAMSAPIPQTAMSASSPVYGAGAGGAAPPPMPSDSGKGGYATTTTAAY